MIREFDNSDALAATLAGEVAAALAARLQQAETAVLAVSGGTTPVRFFQALSALPLDWAKVVITLVDDRWVPETSRRSNALLVRQHLLQGEAGAARFVPLVSDDDTPESGQAKAEAAMRALPLPFTSVILGVGTDGHTASFFPRGDRLAQALAPAAGQLVETMRAEAAGEPRITLTLPVLLAAGHVAIHIEGDTKRRVLEAAMRPGPAAEMPIRAVLARQPAPEIFWCP